MTNKAYERACDRALRQAAAHVRVLTWDDTTQQLAQKAGVCEGEARAVAALAAAYAAVHHLLSILVAEGLASPHAVKGFLDAVADRVSAIRDSPREGGEQ